MTIEVALLVSVVSVAFAIFSGVKNLGRNSQKDTAEEASQMTTVAVKLENIADGVREIKADVREMKTEMNGLRERLTIVEQSSRSAHKRIDSIAQEQSRES